MFTNRQRYIDLAHEHKIANKDICSMAQVFSGRVSDYFQDKPLTPAMETKIEKAISEIVSVYQEFHPFRVEVQDPEVFALAVDVAAVRKAEREATTALSQFTGI